MKEIKRLIHIMKTNGWRCEKGRHNHTVCFAPDGKGTITLSNSPSNKSDALWDIKRSLKKINYEHLFYLI